jgi:hypothetical protein
MYKREPQYSDFLSHVKINTERAGHVAPVGNKEMPIQFCFNHLQKGNHLGDRNVVQRVTFEMDRLLQNYLFSPFIIIFQFHSLLYNFCC